MRSSTDQLSCIQLTFAFILRKSMLIVMLLEHTGFPGITGKHCIPNCPSRILPHKLCLSEVTNDQPHHLFPSSKSRIHKPELHLQNRGFQHEMIPILESIPHPITPPYINTRTFTISDILYLPMIFFTIT